MESIERSTAAAMIGGPKRPSIWDRLMRRLATYLDERETSGRMITKQVETYDYKRDETKR